MPVPARHSRTGFRRAIVASVAAHLIVAGVVVMLVRSKTDATPGRPEIDTRIQDGPLRLPADELPLVSSGMDESPVPSSPRPVAESPAPVAGPPLAAAIPNHLPAELVGLLRRSAASPRPTTDPNLVRVGATTTPPVHGALRPGQTVVYLLDCSGSMGEFGKLKLAREALVATLRRQPDSVRFQLIVYGATARPVFANGFVPANSRSLADVEARLAGLDPSGPSNHAEAVRLAAAARPDVILLLTDAADLSAHKLKPILTAGGKPIPLCVAQVSASGVGSPREFR